ncbi:MAG: hypothetical protein L0216_12470 [Planctomycetales bacterium]|nr:hypothetical protein [Planctomycetales bacterium]
MDIQRLSPERYRISGSGRAVDFDREKFEDLFYAVPVNTTAFYRLLVDNVCATKAEREAMAALVSGEADKEKALVAVQEKIKKLGL